MEFNQAIAKEIIAKENFSRVTLHYWKKQNRIPDKYFIKKADIQLKDLIIDKSLLDSKYNDTIKHANIIDLDSAIDNLYVPYSHCIMYNDHLAEYLKDKFSLLDKVIYNWKRNKVIARKYVNDKTVNPIVNEDIYNFMCNQLVKFQPELSRYALKRCKYNEANADDLLQTSNERTLLSVARLNTTIEKPLAYFYTIMNNTLIQIKKEDKRKYYTIESSMCNDGKDWLINSYASESRADQIIIDSEFDSFINSIEYSSDLINQVIDMKLQGYKKKEIYMALKIQPIKGKQMFEEGCKTIKTYLENIDY